MKDELINKLDFNILITNIIEYEELASTQEEALKLIKNNAKNGTLILAKKQTNGIGTHGRKWYSGEKDKNIIFTLILYPNCSLKSLNGITIKVAECMIKAIKKYEQNVKLEIKEPNDILCNGKKLGGILTQATTKGEIVKQLLIGIGVNINQEIFPDDLEQIATSLKQETKKEYNKADILVDFLNEFEKIYKNAVS